MKHTGTIMRKAAILLASCSIALGASGVVPATAQSIIDEWQNVKPPAAPELKPVNVDIKTTALLILDFNGVQDPTKGPCNAETKPRCLASVPKVKKVLDTAREKGVFIVYSLGGDGMPEDIAKDLAPLGSDPIVRSGPDKFIGTKLRDILDDKGIKTIIVTGTSAEGAVLDTATDAALNGMNIILPVDGMSSSDLYSEQYVTWHMAHAPGVSKMTTLTRTDMITF